MKHTSSKGSNVSKYGAQGAAIIKLLGLSLNEHGRVDMATGDKNEYGLAKTIERVFNDPEFVKSVNKG